MGEPNDVRKPLKEPTVARGRKGFWLWMTRGVLRLYPAAWRERYAEEMLHVLARHPVTAWTVLDMLLGAVDARFHPNFLPERVLSMAHRIRNSEIMIFWAFVLFGLGWLAVNNVRDPLPAWENATHQHPELLTALIIVQATGGVAFLALLAGGAPILFSVLRRTIADRRWGSLLLLLLPLLAIALFLGFGDLAISASTAKDSPAPNAPFTPLAVALQLGLLLLLMLPIILGVFVITRVVGRTSLDVGLLRLVLWPAALVTLALTVGLAATIALIAFSFAEAPELAPGNLTIMMAVMAIATALAVFALRRGIAAAQGSEGAGAA